MNIPEGFKLVPGEPTEEMLEVLHSNVKILVDTWERAADIINDKEWWAAVVESAPTPPQPIYDEAKERELFEIHYRAEYEENSGSALSEEAIKSMRDGPWYGASRHYLNGWGAGWKACAQSRAKSVEVKSD